MASTPAARPPVRVLPVPAYDPPYDDELPPQWWPPDVIQPLLELPGLPWTEDAAPRSDRRQSGAEPPGAAARPAGPERPAVAASPPTVAAAAKFVNTCLEILNGYRPLSHVRALADPLAASAVLAELTAAARRLGPVARREGLLRLRAMRTCEPRPGIAEIAVVVGALGQARGTDRAAGGGTRGGRAWALAFRLERQHGRWLCTAAHLL